MNIGIARTLRELANNEGDRTAIEKAEKWRNVIEEILEVANEDQGDNLVPILDCLNFMIANLQESAQTK